MKRLKWIPALIIMLALLGGIGYSAVFGLGADKSGSLSSIDLGLDLAGGVSITYEVDGEENPSKEDMADTIYKLQQRVDNYSTEAQVYQEGSNRINIEIPGVTDANTILKDLGQPGKLYFIAHLDKDGNENYTYHSGITTDEEGNMTLEEGVMPGYQLNKTIEELEAEGSIILKGENVVVSEVKAQQDQHGASEPVVSLEFNEEGKKAFAEATTKAFNNNRDTIGIYYDGRFISVPAVQAALTDGKAIITGEKTFEAAQNLASMIRIGGLKLELKELRSNVVGAQLGSEAINTSLIAAAVGFALIAIFMIVFFRILGLSATLALGFYSGLIVFLLSAFDITLTLPGIAGIILSIGMAVDANVIIFARLREELATGKTMDSAIKVAYSKAMSAILDGNITTLIAAAVLWIMGSGSIVGFAQTLTLGICLSMFTAIVITKALLKAFVAAGIKDPKFFGVAKQRKTIDFLSKRGLFFGISGLVIAAGLVFMLAVNGGNANRGHSLNYSLEFLGGTQTVVPFEQNYELEEINDLMVADIEKITGSANVVTTKVQGSNEVIFKTVTLNADQRAELNNYFNEKFGIDKETIKTESISSTISKEAQRETIIAVVVACICMLIYIWFRFKDIRFGASSVLALTHDVLVTLAFYAIAYVSVGSSFVACMLTIVGYSINATIVIFDRIRENLKEAAPRTALKDIVNDSITTTLSRSIFTSLTTFIMVVALYIFGVSSIKEFALPLMVGIVCGTYSSICLAGSMWFVFKNKFSKKEK